jgi:hypothetical protein
LRDSDITIPLLDGANVDVEEGERRDSLGQATDTDTEGEDEEEDEAPPKV